LKKKTSKQYLGIIIFMNYSSKNTLG